MDKYAATEQAYKNGYDKGYADAKEELVRCKDCKYWDTGYRFCKFHGLDCFGSSRFGENGFCSYGERKDK